MTNMAEEAERQLDLLSERKKEDVNIFISWNLKHMNFKLIYLIWKIQFYYENEIGILKNNHNMEILMFTEKLHKLQTVVL